MKCLTIRQPWADLIIHGVYGLDDVQVYKPVENRNWRTNFRGRFGVHAAKAFNPRELREALDFLQARGIADCLPGHMHYGCVIGTVDLYDCVSECDSPFFVGPWGFLLRNPQPITPSIPAWGALGFWEWTECPEELR
jgi:hypothetical protein